MHTDPNIEKVREPECDMIRLVRIDACRRFTFWIQNPNTPRPM